MGEPVEIDEILLVDRLVEIIGGLDIVLDFRGQAALAVERTTRRDPHHEERNGDDDEERGNRAHKSPDGVRQHRDALFLRPAGGNRA